MPGTYNIKSSFEKKSLSKNTSPAFGATRNAWEKVYYKERAPLDLTLPGPGAYD